MRTFLEYYQGNPIMAPRMTTGKDPNRVLDRKNVNTVNKEYKHKHPLVDKICQGQCNNTVVRGDQLKQLIALYDLDYELGNKVLGNSKVNMEIKRNNKGHVFGVLTKRD